MKAAILKGYDKNGSNLELRDIPVPEIAEKYNQPHRSTNALLSGIMYCPECGSRLRVVSESNRYTHGKPRFKYSCPKAVRKGSCNYVAVHGVEMDEFIVDYLSKLKENEKDDYKAKLRAEIKNRK